jgi:predicted RNase H-like HicB family nuclease
MASRIKADVQANKEMLRRQGIMAEPLSLTAVYQQDGPWIVAWITEIPGVMTQGATLEEARENLLDALELTLAVRREQAAQGDSERPIVHREMIAVAHRA